MPVQLLGWEKRKSSYDNEITEEFEFGDEDTGIEFTLINRGGVISVKYIYDEIPFEELYEAYQKIKEGGITNGIL